MGGPAPRHDSISGGPSTTLPYLTAYIPRPLHLVPVAPGMGGLGEGRERGGDVS